MLNPPALTDLELAVRAAQGACEVAARYFRSEVAVRVKGAPGNVVTDADLAAEAYVRDLLAEHRPDDGLLGEESGEVRTGQRRWLVDAIDGTLNFVHGDPFWCSAVALDDADGGLVSAIHHAASGETFSAARGIGCWLNGEPLQLGSGPQLSDAVVATYLHPGDAVLPTLQRVLAGIASARIRGSGSLELAWVAAGRIDGWLQRDVHPWDLVPGALLITAAGGQAATIEAADGVWSLAGGATTASGLQSLVRSKPASD